MVSSSSVSFKSKVPFPYWRWLVVALIPPVAALGPYLLPIQMFGVNIYAFRVLIIVVSILILVFNRSLILGGDSVTKFYFFLGYLWLLWGIASLYWAPEFTPALTEVLAVGFGFLTGFVLLNLVSFSERGLQALRTGWVLAYVISSAVAIWEIVSGRHLSSYLSEHSADEVMSRLVASTFGNPNNYAAFLVICFPFLLWSFLGSRGITKLLFLTSLAGLPFLLVLTGGRLGMLAFGLQLVLFFLISGRDLRSVFHTILVVVLACAVLFIALQTSDFAFHKVSNILYEVQVGGSTVKRTGLLLNGIWFAIDSYGLGIGAGGFEYMIKQGYGLYSTGSSINPHSFWIEILSQYGVLVFAGFVAWLGWIGLLALKIRKAAIKLKNAHARLAAEMVLIALLGYLFVASENSSYINQSINWVFLASILAVMSYLLRDGFSSGSSVQNGDSYLE